MKNLIATKMDKFFLKFATPDDTELIFEFIRELASYEKLLHEVVADEQTLKRSLFEFKYAEVIIGYYDKVPVSFALFFYNFSTFLGLPGLYLEDLFVKSKMRGKGIGKIMLAFLANLAKKKNCGRLEWECLDWNEPSIKFYKQIGAKPMNDWTVYRLAGDELEALSKTFN